MSKIHEQLIQNLVGALGSDLLEKIGALKEGDDLTEVSTSINDALADHYFKHDTTRIKALRTDNTGKNMSLFRQAICKRFGVSAKDLEDKAMEDWLEIVEGKVKTNAGLSDDEKTRSLEELRGKVLEYENQITKLRDEELPNALASGDAKVKQYRLDLALTNEISKHQLAGAVDYTRRGLMEDIRNNYVLDFDEQENIVIKTKDGARVPKQGTNAFKGLDEVVLEIGTKSNAFIRSNAGRGNDVNPPAGNTNRQPAQGNPLPPPKTEVERNIRKAQQGML